LRAMRKALLEGAGMAELGSTVLLLLAIGVVLIPLGFVIFSISENYAKRTGLLKRSG
jgi:ABC-2 type transport system permease protein